VVADGSGKFPRGPLPAISTRSPARCCRNAQGNGAARPPSTSRIVPAGMPGRHVVQGCAPGSSVRGFVEVTTHRSPGARRQWPRHLGPLAPIPSPPQPNTPMAQSPAAEGSAGAQGVLQAIWRVGVVEPAAAGKALVPSRVFQPSRTPLHARRATTGNEGWPPAAGAMPNALLLQHPTRLQQVSSVEAAHPGSIATGHGPAGVMRLPAAPIGS